MNIVIDIETIPDQSLDAVSRYLGGEVKCPYRTKKEIGDDLGLSADSIKFTGIEDLKLQWASIKGKAYAEEDAKKKWLKTSLDGDYGQICCICIKSEEGEETFTGPEDEILSKFWLRIRVILKGRAPMFIAHNAKFDLPFIWKRSVIHGEKPHSLFNPKGRHRKDYFCTMEEWAGYGGKIGLSRLSEILSIGQKEDGMTGADVWPEYQSGNIEKIAAYCAQDVQLTSDIYDRLTFK